MTLTLTLDVVLCCDITSPTFPQVMFGGRGNGGFKIVYDKGDWKRETFFMESRLFSIALFFFLLLSLRNDEGLLFYWTICSIFVEHKAKSSFSEKILMLQDCRSFLRYWLYAIVLSNEWEGCFLIYLLDIFAFAVAAAHIIIRIYV